MAQIFLGNNAKSLAVDIMAKYTRAVDADLVQISRVTAEQQKCLDIPTVPCMIVTEGDKTFKCTSPYAIFKHIAQLTRFESIFLGRTDLENQQVLSYFELIGSLSVEELGSLLNNDLQLRMFLVTYNITAADIFAYAHLVNFVGEMQDFEKLANNNLFRWIDHIQHLPGIDKYAKSHNLTISFPNESAKQPSKRELKKAAKKQYQAEHKKEGKKDKKEENKDAPKAATEHAQPDLSGKSDPAEETKTETSESTNATKKEKKPKQQQQNKQKKGGDKAAEEAAEPISQLDIRVGKIVKVWKHPESEKLYCEHVDIGEEQPREIASGLQKFVPIERMENAHVIVLCNLKSKKLAGFPSHGMVMCAETPDKSAVELLVPPEGSKPGDLVTIKGFERKPADVLNPKKKILESVIGDFNIDASGVAKYKDAEWTTEKGTIVSENIRNGIIA